ncbi:MAG: ABC transporter ATP-binding protein [Actinomycetota bacterium]
MNTASTTLNTSGSTAGSTDPLQNGNDNVARLVGATKVFGTGDAAVTALDSVTLGFRRGEFTAVMGPSGSGKSTLMYCQSGLDRLTEGQAFVGDVDVSTLSDQELSVLRRSKLGFIFQSFHLVPALSARENITLPVDLDSKAAVDEDFLAELAGVLGIDHRLNNRPSELSGGQRQRVAVARAMIPRPDVIFADEPTGALDSKTSGELLAYLRKAVDELGQTIVMVTHDAVAASYCDRVVYVQDGRLVGEALNPTVDDVLGKIRELS